MKTYRKNGIEFAQKALLSMKSKLHEMKKFTEELFDPSNYIFEEYPDFLMDLYS